MLVRLINDNAKYVNFVDYEYGTDLFGNIYLDKIKGKIKKKMAKVEKTWILSNLGELVRILDLEIYKKEIRNYRNITKCFL